MGSRGGAVVNHGPFSGGHSTANADVEILADAALGYEGGWQRQQGAADHDGDGLGDLLLIGNRVEPNDPRP